MIVVLIPMNVVFLTLVDGSHIAEINKDLGTSRDDRKHQEIIANGDAKFKRIERDGGSNEDGADGGGDVGGDVVDDTGGDKDGGGDIESQRADGVPESINPPAIDKAPEEEDEEEQRSEIDNRVTPDIGSSELPIKGSDDEAEDENKAEDEDKADKAIG